MVYLFVLILQVLMNLAHNPIQGLLKGILIKVLFKVLYADQERCYGKQIQDRPFFSVYASFSTPAHTWLTVPATPLVTTVITG